MNKIVVVGSLNLDMVIEVERIPVVGETILGYNIKKTPGGKGANQSYAAGKLGASVTILGAIGDDDIGVILKENLQLVGVCTDYLKVTEKESSGLAIVAVDEEGDNSIIVIQGANKTVDREYIDLHMEIIKESDIVICQLEIPLDTVLYVAKKAKEYGKIFILDPAPAQKELPEELLCCVDILKPNETELEIMTGLEAKTENLKKATDYLKSKGVGNVLVTLGKDGTYLNDENNNIQLYNSYKVNSVDTTAAGDAYMAALAFSLSKGENLSSSIRYASIVSSIVVSRKGAQSSIPSREEVEEYQKKLSNQVTNDLGMESKARSMRNEVMLTK
ncbi:MAG TPA: ribokinase [Mobilitalea sp.]|nr:ribokinase [Mobilitalea sp.]